MKRTILLLLAILLWGGTSLLHAQAEAPFLPSAADARCKQWVDSVFSGLNLQEKVGQLIVTTFPAKADKQKKKQIRDLVKKYKIGGLLFAEGTPEEQAILTNIAQKNSKVPVMITFDGEWGLSMRLEGTPYFPKNAALGCIEDNQLIYEYGREVAREFRELGVHVNFAPDADVNTNPLNPVIHVRSFGEDPKKVAEKVLAYSRGLESGGVLSVSKHFPGHGDTDVDSHKGLPVLYYNRERLDSVELYPFREMVRAGLGGVMVGRTPEFLGKKVEAREMKIATVVALLHPFVILVGTALSTYLFAHHPDFVASEGGWLNNPGFHGLSEQLYEFTSCAANNGSGFEGLGDNTYFWNYSCGWVLILSRFIPIVGQVAIAGLLAQKKFIPESAGTLKTDTVTFAVMTFAVIFIVAALSFFPVHALGTIAEHFSL